MLRWDHCMDADWLWQVLAGLPLDACYDCVVCPEMGTDIQIGRPGQKLVPLSAG